jgi:protein Tex
MSEDAAGFESWFGARHPDIRIASARAVLELAGEGATVPFIARYRKERTGNLDEVQIQKALSARERWERIVARQAVILEAIERQKKLTPDLEQRIRGTLDLDLLEDLYLPYKQKRKSKANVAREAGLEPLADWIWNCAHGTDTPQPGQTLELWAFTFRNPEKGVGDLEAALRGAEDILVERLDEMADLRSRVRASYWEKGFLASQKAAKAKPNSKYENYFAHHEKIAGLRDPAHSHRYLAMRRGVAEGELQWSLGGAPGDAAFDDTLLRIFELMACAVAESPGADLLLRAARRSLKEHVVPSIENELHRDLKEASDEAAIRVFAENVRRVLLAPPFGPKPVVAVDPGLRTGCKLAVVDASGAYVASDVVHLQSDEGKAKGKERLFALVRDSQAEAVAVGNGTAGRETETFVRESLKEQGLVAPVVLVSEAGASVYSASEIAREELPDLDVTVRGAVSIARRLQDPLAELVKIEPKSIGVGQYQHDVSGRALERSLEHVVDPCVNQVGVNLNTASAPLLAHVSGIGPALAKAVVQHREEHGLFASRAALLDVARFSTKSFEQAAGFLRVPGAAHPLDNTGTLCAPGGARDHPRQAARRAPRGRGRRGAASERPPRGGGGVHVRRHRERAGEARSRSSRGLRAVRVPRGHPPARRPEARNGLPGHRHECHQLRGFRGHRRAPGWSRPHLADGRPLREGPPRDREPRRPRAGARDQGGPRQEADLAHPEACGEDGATAGQGPGEAPAAARSRRGGEADGTS